MISKILEIYARTGRSLIGIGITEAAIPLEEAIYMLDLIPIVNWIVLGGDIYGQREDGILQPTYDSWHYDEGSLDQSIVAAREYLAKFTGKQFYISFTFSELS